MAVHLKDELTFKNHLKWITIVLYRIRLYRYNTIVTWTLKFEFSKFDPAKVNIAIFIYEEDIDYLDS